MILHGLDRYYQRLASDSESFVPLFGFSRQNIHFALLIDGEGNLLQVRDLREIKGKRLVPKQLIVPEPAIKSVNIAANFLWGNTGYALGVDQKGNRARSGQSFSAFKRLHHEIGDGLADEGMRALLRFLDSWNPEMAPSLDHWEEMSAGSNIVFQMDGDLHFLQDREAIRMAWLRHVQLKEPGEKGICLVSGDEKPIARLHPKIKGVRDAQPMGASLISFNLDAFESYGKKQNFNAPVSQESAFNYTTALNHLLNPDSRQKVQIGDATTVFWSERDSPLEGFLGMILDPREDKSDLKEIRDFLEAIRDGKMPREFGDSDVRFYILGLSPNASRISVRFWHASSVGAMRERIGQHFRDLRMIKNYDNDPEFPGMWQLLRETALQGKSDNIQPLLAGSVVRSILTGSPYPETLLWAVIGRMRADQNINYLRAAIIKACLVRKRRLNDQQEEVTMSLDRESINVGYRLGRLFAVLEKAQKDAVPGASTTIKDRYYGSASATPRSVFPQLLRLAQHHIQKAEYGRLDDNMIEEIMLGINAFPPSLSLEDQGMFAIGYYHQRNAFFQKIKNREED